MTSQNATAPVNVPELLSQLLVGAEALQMTRFATAAAGTVYIYAIFTTFGDEVEYFWSTLKLTFPNLLYIINRYVCLGFFLNIIYDMSGFHGDFTQAYCTKCTGVIGITLAHLSWLGIMTIRVGALWRSHPRLVYSLWALWVAVMAFVVVFTYLSYKSVTSTMTYNTYMRICATDHIPKIMVAAPLPPTLYELLLTILTIVKTYKFINAAKASSPPILHVLARDGVIYFVLSSVISVTNMLSWHFLPPQLGGFFLYMYWALLSTFTSYLTLNLRRAYYHGRANETEQISSHGFDATITFARMPHNPPNTRVDRHELEREYTYDDDFVSAVEDNSHHPRRPPHERERFTSSSSVWVIHDLSPPPPSHTRISNRGVDGEPMSAGTARSSSTGRRTSGTTGNTSPRTGAGTPSGSGGNPAGLKAACAFIMGDGEFFQDPSQRRSPTSDEGSSTQNEKKSGDKREKKDKDLEKWGAREDVVVDAIPLTKLVQARSR